MVSLGWARAKGLFELALREIGAAVPAVSNGRTSDSSPPEEGDVLSAPFDLTESASGSEPAVADRSAGRLEAGTRLGPYEILALIGAGGMGEVYKARDNRLQRTVAIKVPRARHDASLDRRRRFEQEALAIAALMHPHVCVLHDVGDEHGIAFFVMEYLDGQTLADRLLNGPLPLDDVLRFGVEIADALAAAHRRGIIHRDLKPGNIMLTKDGVKLLDFGLARLLPPPVDDTIWIAESQDDTAEGTVFGTLPYMAPEQLEGGSSDARADIFSLGAVLYEMAGGRRAFTGHSPASLIEAILRSNPDPLESFQPTLPLCLDAVVRRCLAKDPSARWQRAADVRDELRRVGSSIADSTTPLAGLRRRRTSHWAAAAMTLPIASAATTAICLRGGGPPTATETVHTGVTDRGVASHAALAPDGRTIAYVTGEAGREVQVMMRDLPGGEARCIWTGRKVTSVAWLPDGSHVVITGEGSSVSDTWIVARLGGAHGGPKD